MTDPAVDPHAPDCTDCADPPIAPPEADAELIWHHPEVGHMPGYRVGRCRHRVAGSEWRIGLRTCEHCDPADYPTPVPESWAVPQ